MVRSPGGHLEGARGLGGTSPSAHSDACVKDVLARQGVTVPVVAPRPLTRELLEKSSLVVAMGCPAGSLGDGHEIEEWPVADPGELTPEGAERVSLAVRDRVVSLLERRGWNRFPGTMS